MPTGGGRKTGSSNYTEEELRHCFGILREILPIGSEEWQRVADRHAEKYPGRDVDSIRRKYSNCHRKQVPTGDPTCPWDIKEAKYIKYLIGQKAGVGQGEDVYDLSAEDGRGAFISVSAPPDPGSTTQTQQTQQSAPAVDIPLRQPSQLTGRDDDDFSDSDAEEEEVVDPPVAAVVATPAANNRPRSPSPHSSSNSTKRSYTRRGPPPVSDEFLHALTRSLENQTRALMQQNKLQEDANKEAKADREHAKSEAKEDRKMLIEALCVAVRGRPRRKRNSKRKRRRSDNSSSSSSTDDSGEEESG